MLKYLLLLQKILLYTILCFVLCQCGQNSNTKVENFVSGNNSDNAIALDQISSIPLINGKNSTFYLYAKNVSSHELKNISWSIISLGTKSSVADIIDQTDCVQLAPQMSCRLIISANKIGQIQINASSAGKKLTFSGAGNGLLQIKNYAMLKVVNQSNLLTFSGIKDIKLDNHGGDYDFFVVNNGNSPIALDLAQPLANIPPEVKVFFAACVNPIVKGAYCQIHLSFLANKKGYFKNIYLPLIANARYKDSNGYFIPLPKQNNAPVILATTGSLDYPLSSDTRDASHAPTISLKVTPGAPVINPNLSVVANSLFAQDINQAVSTTSPPYVIELTNNSTKSDPAGINVGDATLFIPYQSLMPVNSPGFSYYVDGIGLSNACATKNGTFPTSGASVVLHQGATCSYNLYIAANATATPATLQNLLTTFNYFVYTQGSPNQPTLGTSSVTNSFTLSSYTPNALLDIAVSPTANANAFNNVILGSTNPTISLTITNIGNKNVVGALSAVGLPTAVTIAFSNCNNLGVNQSCTATLTLSTQSVVSGNLGSAIVSFSGGQAPLPSINYAVINQAAPPIVTENTVVNGCAAGDGVVDTCFVNPDSMGGNASQVKVGFIFKNSSTTPVTSLNLSSNIDADLLSKGYIFESALSNCNNGIAANGGTCQIIYAINPAAATTPLQTNIVNNGFSYTLTYGTAQLLNNTASLNLSINVVAPILSISGPIGSMVYASGYAANPNNVVITISNLYQNSTPILNNIVSNTDGSATSSASASAGNCVVQPAYSATCSSQITLSNNPGIGAYLLNSSLSSAPEIKTSSAFYIINPTIFMTRNTFSVNDLNGLTGADQQCNNAAAAAKSLQGVPLKALLLSPGRYPCDGSGLCGGVHSNDWPILNAGVGYYSVGNQYFNRTNANFVFDGSNSNFYDELGIRMDQGSLFWFGVQSIHINNSVTDIDAWAYDLESTSYARSYNNFVTSCNNYTGRNSTNNALPNIGIVGTPPQYFSAGAYIPDPANSWGGWSQLIDDYASSMVNVWSAAALPGLANPVSCNPDTLHLVCVTPF